MKEIYPILAIDYGEKNFGLAISDSKGIIASPLEVLSISKNRDINSVIGEILLTCEEYRVKSILIGKPQIFTKSQEKTERKINKFIDLVKNKTTIPILTQDESFSTTQAENMLTFSGQNIKNTKNKIDKIAATVFLQEFLNSNNKNDEK
jgi:putative holliday junction resolvase